MSTGNEFAFDMSSYLLSWNWMKSHEQVDTISSVLTPTSDVCALLSASSTWSDYNLFFCWFCHQSPASASFELLVGQQHILPESLQPVVNGRLSNSFFDIASLWYSCQQSLTSFFLPWTPWTGSVVAHLLRPQRRGHGITIFRLYTMIQL